MNEGPLSPDGQHHVASPTRRLGPLTDVERAVLEFERTTWSSAGRKEAEVLDRFGWMPTRYSQVVMALVDRPEALAYDPLTIGRLRRLRDARHRSRTRQGGDQR